MAEQQSELGTMHDILASIATSENEDFLAVLASEMNAFMFGLARLEGTGKITPEHARRFVQRLRLMLAGHRLSEPGPQQYAPPGQKQRATAESEGLKALEQLQGRITEQVGR